MRERRKPDQIFRVGKRSRDGRFLLVDLVAVLAVRDGCGGTRSHVLCGDDNHARQSISGYMSCAFLRISAVFGGQP